MAAPRIAGCVIPLFSVRTERDWGIGQITDLPACAVWVRSSGHKLLQILPPYELAQGETSPYGARTAFGLDPIYIGIESIEDLDEAAIDQALGAEGKSELARLRAAKNVDYASVRKLKERIFEVAFARFYESEWTRGTPRADHFRAFLEHEQDWLADLSLYVALREKHHNHSWQFWPLDVQNREAPALDHARKELAKRILEHQYLQWVAHVQWDRARGEMRGVGVELMGDMPFVVGRESADVWQHPNEFRRDASLGAPPDAFSPDGQDWGLPPYDIDAMQANDLAWMRARTRHAARLYDRFRLDHVVGYFRQWVKGADKGSFVPSDEPEQRHLGQHLLEVIKQEAAPARVIAEDLGVIPPFVRESMKHLELPGYKVIPWERDDGIGYRDPEAYPRISVATYSTHDTAPITAWWDEMDTEERAGLSKLAHLDHAENENARWLGFLKLLYSSSSELTLTLSSELLGDKDRINTPGTVGGVNWTYRLPQTLEALSHDDSVVARMADVKTLIEQSGR